jgi:hypothetical protein
MDQPFHLGYGSWGSCHRLQVKNDYFSPTVAQSGKV